MCALIMIYAELRRQELDNAGPCRQSGRNIDIYEFHMVEARWLLSDLYIPSASQGSLYFARFS
jgi:hypothetical protein